MQIQALEYCHGPQYEVVNPRAFHPSLLFLHAWPPYLKGQYQIDTLGSPRRLSYDDMACSTPEPHVTEKPTGMKRKKG